jgi:iron complex outermembrane recepter protein
MKLRYFITLVAIVFATQVSNAQNKIIGKVKNAKTNETLSGATVYVSDLKLGVSSNINGDFKIENIKTGNYLLEISLEGYNNFVQKINLTKDIELSISLYPSVSELNEVVITAVSRSTELKRSPVIIKAIDKNTLNQNSSTNLIDALKNIPGISQISTGASISKPIIRGLGYNRVISLYNGIRQEGQQWGDEHGIEIDEYDIDRIEIVKGPGSLLYGSDGIAGVINFLSQKAPHLGEIKSQLVTNYQSNNNLIGYSYSNAGNKNGLQWLGRFSNKYAGNYENKYDGKVYNSGFKEYDGSLFLGINKNWGHSHFNFSTFNSTLNLVEGERDSTGNFIFLMADGSQKTATDSDLKGYKTGFSHQVINHIRFSSNNYFILKNGTINADFAFQNNQRKEFGDVANPKDMALYFYLSTFNYNVRYNFKEKNGWETSVGIGGMQQSNTNKGLEFLIPAYNLFDVGAFLFTQKAINKNITLSGGLRFDNRAMNAKELILDSLGTPTTMQDLTNQLKFNAFNLNYNGISGSIGLSYTVSKTSTLKFNVSRGYRAPTIAELASNGRHEGTFRYEIGNQNLNSEISHQIDIAYFLNSEHITFEVTPFANFISNYVYSKKMKDAMGNDIIIDPSDPAPAYKFEQGNAMLVGGEVYLDIHPHPLDWLHIENSFSYVQATQNNQSDSTKYLPFIPAPKYRGELKAQFKKVGKKLTNAYIKFGVDYSFKQDNIFSAFGTETVTPSYTLLSVGIGGNIKAFKKKDFMSIFISAENVANTAFQSHLSRLKYSPENLVTGRSGVFNMGRNMSFKLIFNL